MTRVDEIWYVIEYTKQHRDRYIGELKNCGHSFEK